MKFNVSNLSKELKVVPLEEVTWFQEGPGVRRHQYTDKGIKLLNVGNIQRGKLELSRTNRFISEEEAHGKYSHFLGQAGDIVIASSGITVDSFEEKVTTIEKEHLPLCMNTSTIRFQVTKKDLLNQKFLKYFLKSSFFKEQVRSRITGSAQLNFGPTHLKEMTIPLPPLPEQQRIAALLEQVDHLRHLRQRALQRLDDLVQSTFLEMFGDPVTNPKGWEQKSLGDISQIKTGSTPSRKKNSYYNGNIPWVKTTEVIGEEIHESEEKITEQGLINSNCKLLPRNTILLAMYGQGRTRGRVGILKVEATTNQACAAILPTDSLNHNFLFEYLKTQYEEIRELGRGGNQPNLNLSMVKNFAIIVPPKDMQIKFSDLSDKIKYQKQQNKTSLNQLDTLFNALMQQAFTGQLQWTSAEDAVAQAHEQLKLPLEV